jgi:hypothetical protein
MLGTSTIADGFTETLRISRMFEVLKTEIDGVEHQRVESDYELSWTEMGDQRVTIRIETPWLNKENPRQHPCCTCEGNPQLFSWHAGQTSCDARKCKESWELGWGEEEFFNSPEAEQTEEKLVERLKSYGMDDSYQLRRLSDGEEQAEAEEAEVAKAIS